MAVRPRDHQQQPTRDCSRPRLPKPCGGLTLCLGLAMTFAMTLIATARPSTSQAATETVSQTLPAGGGTVTTDSEGDGTTASDQIETTLISPNGGVVTIVEDDLPDGQFQVSITAPAATANAPISLVFLLDASAQFGAILDIRHDGLPVLDCSGTPATAQPDPCFDSRLLLIGGGVETTILASQATGVWNIAKVGSCGVAPAIGCLAGQKAFLKIKVPGNPARQQLRWKLLRADAFSQDDLASPNTAAYTLCVYDETADVASLVAELVIDPLVIGWRIVDPRGFKYKDTSGSQDGIIRVQLKTGDQGRARAKLRAGGVTVPLPEPLSPTQFFDQDSTVTVQFINSQSALCWTSEFAQAKTNTPKEFKAKSP